MRDMCDSALTEIYMILSQHCTAQNSNRFTNQKIWLLPKKKETENLELNISFTFGQPLILNAGKDLSHWFEPRTFEGDDELEVRLWYHPILRINTYFTPEVCTSGILLQK